MDIALLYNILNILKDYMSDILVVLCVLGLVVAIRASTGETKVYDMIQITI